jgi:hypothetical protein
MPMDNKLGKMHRQGATDQAYLSVRFALGQEIAAAFFNNSKALDVQYSAKDDQYQAEAVFIPTKEVLSLVKGMNEETHDHKTVELIFDDGYVDLAKVLMGPAIDDVDSKINFDPRLNSIIPQLVNLIGGRYQLHNGGFCFQAGRYKPKASPNRTKAKAAQMYQDSTTTEFVPIKGQLYSSGMTAEGYRKIGIFHRLLSNGTISPGSSGPLFWDEPESNMNPKLMKLLVQTILELSRNGQQIILGTHDYVLLKWLDLLADKGKGDHVRYHSIYQNGEKNDLRIETSDDYSTVSRSAISNAFAELYDEDIKRALG